MRYFIAFFALLSVLTAVLGILILIFQENIVKKKVIADLVVREESPSTISRWKGIPNGKIIFNVFVYDYSKKNEDNQPKEIGPLVFTVNKIKKEERFHDADHISFKEYSTFILDENRTSSDLQQFWSGEQMISTVSDSSDGTVTLEQISIQDILFGKSCGPFKNNSHNGDIVMNTGNSDVNLMRIIQSIDEIDKLSFGATDGYQFPNVTENSKLKYWDTNLGQVVLLEFQEFLKLKSIHTLKFVVKQPLLSAAPAITRPKTTMTYQKKESPSFIVEPLSGLVFSYNKTYDVGRGVGRTQVSIARFEEVLESSEESLQYLERTVNYRLKVVQSSGGYSLVFSVVLFLLALFTMKRFRKRSGHVEFDMKPMVSNRSQDNLIQPE
jgi:hypothetical protein